MSERITVKDIMDIYERTFGDTNPCNHCIVAQNYNLEDDDSPCLNCEEGNDAD